MLKVDWAQSELYVIFPGFFRHQGESCEEAKRGSEVYLNDWVVEVVVLTEKRDPQTSIILTPVGTC